MSKELYRWQEDCLENWFKNEGRGIVQAVTGTGKTFLALSVLKRMDEKTGNQLRVKIVVPTAELMRQWEHSLRDFLKEPGNEEKSLRGVIGLRGGGHNAESDCKYMIYVINSARYELARRILGELREGEQVLMIADECHHYVSGQNRLIFEFLPHLNGEQASRFYSLGLTATLPGGQARQYLASVLGKRIYSYGMKEAAAQSTVCECDIYHIGLTLLKEEKETYEELTERMNILYRKLVKGFPLLREAGQRERFEILRQIAGSRDKRAAQTALLYIRLTYKRKSLVCLASERLLCACDLIACLDINEKIIIFGERVSQAEELYQILNRQYPERVGRYHSRMGYQANKNVLERFRAGNIRILITCKALDEGVDVPDVSVGIVLSGTSVKRQRVQRMGRIIRIQEGKGRASLYYLHTEETAEETYFLPDIGKGQLLELQYRSGDTGFMNPEYDDKAETLLEHMEEAGADGRKLREAERCLRKGRVRSDWRRKPQDIDIRIREAKYREDKNYWVCMKNLSSER